MSLTSDQVVAPSPTPAAPPAPKANAPEIAVDTVRTGGGKVIERAAVVVPKPEGDTAPPVPEGERPAWLPEQFKTPEEFAKSYADLRKKMSTEGAPDGEKTEATPPAEEKPAENEKLFARTAADKEYEVETYGEMIAGVLEKAGVNAKVMSAEFHETGKVSDSVYAKFEEAGISKTVLDTYLSGSQDKAEKVAAETKQIADAEIAKIKDSVGGQEEFTKLVTWAKAGGLKPAEIAEYDEMVNAGSPRIALRAVAWLKERYVATEGKEPEKIAAGDTKPNNGSEDGFQSREEIVAAMKDPRYKKGDPAYHAMVQRKLMKSKVI